jgi:S1-C subfamily serine protease
VGSGVIIRQPGPFVYVLTAQHVVEQAERVDVAVFSAQSYPTPDRAGLSAEVIARDKDADLALHRFPARAAARICPPRSVPDGKGFAALPVGCGVGEPPIRLPRDD